MNVKYDIIKQVKFKVFFIMCLFLFFIFYFYFFYLLIISYRGLSDQFNSTLLYFIVVFLYI